MAQSEQQALALQRAMKLGREHHLAGRLPEAEQIYQEVLQVDPSHSDALQLLGVLALQVGKNEVAVELIEKAHRVRPSDPVLLYHLARAYQGLGRIDRAQGFYRQALLLRPDYAEAHNNLGVTLEDQGQLDAAIASYQRALSCEPDFAMAYFNLGNALKALGKLEEAIESYRKAVSCKPDYAEARSNLGVALADQGQLDEAIASYRKAVSCKPDYSEAHTNLGAAFANRGQLDDAIASYRKAISCKPDSAEAHFNLGVALHEQGKFDLATISFQRALQCDPENGPARWSIAMSKLPAVYGVGVAPSTCLAEFDAALAELDEWFRGERVKEGFKAVGSVQPFYLAYQEMDNRALLLRSGSLCCRLMDDWLRRQAFTVPQRAATRSIRIGIISKHFRDHSVWHALVKGWLRNLDRQRFELHLFYLGSTQDDETSFARQNATTFTQGKGGLRQWVESILGHQLDAIVYPEIGMDPMTLKLASIRLAPVQAAAWGHPETTGLPSIDHYISAEAFEPANASANYTERLVALPRLGCCYHPLPVEPTSPDFSALGIADSSPLLICPGQPFKYAPQHDGVLVEIARCLGECRLVFFTQPRVEHLSHLLRDRLRSVFADAGLKYDDFVLFIPWQERSLFYGLMQRATVYLDTIGFSGFNTAMQAVECGLPIVTREGRFMRGRFASGILKIMGLHELIAQTDEAYVRLATKLASDAQYRRGIRERLAAHRSVLYDDMTPVRALEDLLSTAVGRD